MGVFHYKAEFIKRDKTYVFYRFYPEYIDFEGVFGEFQIRLENWKSTINSKTEIENRNSYFSNDRPVSALTYKIKKHFEETDEFPNEAFHMA